MLREAQSSRDQQGIKLKGQEIRGIFPLHHRIKRGPEEFKNK